MNAVGNKINKSHDNNPRRTAPNDKSLGLSEDHPKRTTLEPRYPREQPQKGPNRRTTLDDKSLALSEDHPKRKILH